MCTPDCIVDKVIDGFSVVRTFLDFTEQALVLCNITDGVYRTPYY
jgi:hypothetical protein